MHGIVNRTLVKDKMYNTFPSVTRAADGKLVLVYRQAIDRQQEFGKRTHVDPSSCVAMITSYDNGESWTEPEVIYNDEMGEQDPCIVCLSDGTLICTFFRWKVVPKEDKVLLGPSFDYYGRIVFDKWASVHVGTMCIRSEDNGKTWNGPFPIKPDCFQGPAAMRGNVIELMDGTLLAPLYATKKYGDLSQSLVAASNDEGKSWHYLGEVPAVADHHFVEPFIYRAPSGRIDILMRTQLDFFKYPFDETYCNLHISHSFDNGRTWTIPEETDLFCPNPVNVLNIDSTKVLFTYGQRKDPKGIEWFITDAEKPLISKNEVKMLRLAGAGADDLGYTSAVKLSDSRVLIVYYMTDSDNSACIGASFLEI